MLIDALRLVDQIVEPSGLLCILILASAGAAIARLRRVAAVLQAVAVVIVVLIGVLPAGAWLAAPLEIRFPLNPPLPAEISGIVALGGTERLALSSAWDQPILSDPTPIAALAALGRRYPNAKLVFSGGAALSERPSFTESTVVGDFLNQMGVDARRIVYEDRSRNTLENAVFTRELVKPDSNPPWILITQAISMPRAVAVFRHAGWNVIPFPAGYLTDADARSSIGLHLLSGLSLASIAIHEWGGLLAYRLAGYTDILLPR